MKRRLKFQMEAKNDLSARADFSFEFVKAMGGVVREAVDTCEALKEIRSKAKVDVTVSSSLSGLDIAIKVIPNSEPMSEDERSNARAQVGEIIQQTVKSRITDVLQSTMSATRARVM